MKQITWQVIYYFCTVARLFPIISIVNYLNCTLIAGVKSSIHGYKVFNCNWTVNGLVSATVLVSPMKISWLQPCYIRQFKFYFNVVLNPFCPDSHQMRPCAKQCNIPRIWNGSRLNAWCLFVLPVYCCSKCDLTG